MSAVIPIGGAPDVQPLLKPDEVAALLGVSEVWVYQHANGRRRPHLPSIKLGGAVRFERAAIQEFIKRMRREAQD